MRQAVVMGGGFCGLIAARVLSDHVESVEIIERDVLPDGPVARKGVPQSEQMHVLMALGQRLLERFFPGIDRQLAERSCPSRDQTRDVRVFVSRETGFAPAIPSGLMVRSASRPMLEAVIRGRVKAIPNVRFTEGESVAGIAGTPATIDPLITKSGRRVTADLFVVALGRTTPFARWLEPIVGAAVEHSVTSSRLGYATRTCRIGNDAALAEADLVVPAQYPDNPRGGGIRRIENDLVQVTMAGYLGSHPGTTPDEFAAYAGELADPAIADVLARLEGVSPIHAYRDTANSVHRYDRLRVWPGNLVIMGDALCSLNPFYGQGMTMALVECALLQESLAARRALGRGFQRRLWRAVQPFLAVASRLDAQWARLATGGPGPLQRIVFRLKNELVAESYLRPGDALRFAEARNHLRSPMRALTPSLAARALLRLLRGA